MYGGRHTPFPVGLMHVANAIILHGYFSLTYIGHIVAGGGHTLTNVDWSPRRLGEAGVSHNIGLSGIFAGLAACVEWTSSP